MKNWVWVLTFIFLFQWSALANIIRLDQSVYVSDRSGSKITAFRSGTNCNFWEYMPGRYWATGSFFQTTERGSTTYQGQTYQNYFTLLQFDTKPGYSQDDLDKLKDLIAGWVSPECPKGSISKESLVLAPVLVRNLSALHNDKEYGDLFNTSSAGYYSTFQRTGSGHAMAFSDPNAFNSVTLTMDATKEAPAQFLAKLKSQMSKNEPSWLGDLGMVVYGIKGHINSHLTINGNMKAKFKTVIKSLCSTDNDNKQLIAGLPLEYSDRRTICAEHLVRQYGGGQNNEFVTIDHTDSVLDVAGKDIMYSMCTEQGDGTIACPKVSLANFVEFRLFYEFLKTNYDQAMDFIIDATQNRSEGDVNTPYTINAAYLRNFQGSMLIDVPVYAYKLDQDSFKMDWADKSRFACFAKKYVEMRKSSNNQNQLPAIPSTMPLPAAEECLNVGN